MCRKVFARSSARSLVDCRSIESSFWAVAVGRSVSYNQIARPSAPTALPGRHNARVRLTVPRCSPVRVVAVGTAPGRDIIHRGDLGLEIESAREHAGAYFVHVQAAPARLRKEFLLFLADMMIHVFGEHAQPRRVSVVRDRTADD